MHRASETGRPTTNRRAWLAAPIGLLVLLGACESTDSNRPTSTKPGSTKRPVSKSPASWGAVSDAGATPRHLDPPEPAAAP